jgi:hypothetical protein
VARARAALAAVRLWAPNKLHADAETSVVATAKDLARLGARLSAYAPLNPASWA